MNDSLEFENYIFYRKNINGVLVIKLFLYIGNFRISKFPQYIYTVFIF